MKRLTSRKSPISVFPNTTNTDSRMKRFVATAAVALAISAMPAYVADAQNYEVREQIRADRMKASGLDNIVSFEVPALTAAPEGYEPFYISHYGRHGSRYAYTERAYTDLLNMLSAAQEKGNLTEYGENVLSRLKPFYGKVKYRVGDLTELGWAQHHRIAENMVKFFPSVFSDGACVDAIASTSIRAIMSMASCCLSLQQLRPDMEIYEHQGFMEVQATAPNTGTNALRYKGPELVYPFEENTEQFIARRFPAWKDIYSRMFKDADAALGKRQAYSVLVDTYMLVAGMASLPEGVREDFSDLFTPEEYATMWEVDNLDRFREYYKYKTACSSILDDIVAKADARISSDGRGANLRFGHDHVFMTLLMLMDIDGFETVPANADELPYWFQTYRSPMAANMQYVFYKPVKSEGDVLVKLLVNGEECHLGSLKSDIWPYYRWEDVKAFLKAQVRKYVYTPEELAEIERKAKEIDRTPAQWVRDTLSQGCVYHSYSGYDPISGSMQNVNVMEVDMNNPRYKVRFNYDSKNGVPTSEVAARYGAVAAINAAYETSSVFIRTNDTTYHAIENELVMNTPVPQWRNDGGVYSSADGRKVRIDGSASGLTLKDTRKYYAKRSRKWANMLTSAPMLIDDYQPVGETFAEKGLEERQISMIHYEDPLRHQHVRHPRTAVALTADNRFLMITVDGRWPGFAEGMNACELTKFLAGHFNPRYALNMDGGGSTTMTVAGHGDPKTGVVNYPTDNKVRNHDGQRRVRTHILVIDSQ